MIVSLNLVKVPNWIEGATITECVCQHLHSADSPVYKERLILPTRSVLLLPFWPAFHSLLVLQVLLSSMQYYAAYCV